MSSSSSNSYNAEKSRKEAERARAEERAMDWRTYTDKFGNKVRVSGKTGEFQVKMLLWGWMGSSFKGNMERRYINGDLYVGGVHGSLRHGKGKMLWNDTGDAYDGDWVYNKMSGKGKYTWASGAYYEGDFVDGNFNGHGIRVYNDGCKYEGQFKDDNRHGRGKMTWPSGDTYEGDWFEDFRTGNGRYVWTIGGYHEGGFLKGKFHGKGKHLYTDNYLYEGDFKDGVRHGKGVLTAPDGTAVEYYYENDKRVCKVSEASDEIIARIYGSTPGEASVATKVDKEATVAKKISVAPVTEEVTESNADVWNKLLGMTATQRNDFLASHSVVVVPDGTKKIPEYMFDRCSNLKEVRFNQELLEIGTYAFRECKNLNEELIIPKSVVKICVGAFSNCHSIRKIFLPNNVTVEKMGLMCSVKVVEFETEPPIGVVLEKSSLYFCDKTMSKEMKQKIKDINPKAFK